MDPRAVPTEILTAIESFFRARSVLLAHALPATRRSWSGDAIRCCRRTA